MTTRIPRLRLAFIALTWLTFAGVNSAVAQGTAFTYTGRLNNNGAPVNGAYDLRFTIYDSEGGVNIIAGPLHISPVAVANGLFSVRVDFGVGVFTGPARWLEISVRPVGIGNFATLEPRQELTSSPYAIRAATAATAGDVSAGSVVKSLNTLKGDVTLAPGANVTITPNGNTLTLAATGAGETGIWSVNGNNAFYNAGNVGIGTNNSAFKLDIAGSVNISEGSAYRYNGRNIILASSSLRNDFLGQFAGNLTMTGRDNVGVGYSVLRKNVSGAYNTGVGVNAFELNTSGSYNSAFGDDALNSNTTGNSNVAVGYGALIGNSVGDDNVAVGKNAMAANTNGSATVAIGSLALQMSTSGSEDVAVGQGALQSLTSGGQNTAVGAYALQSHTDQANSSALGYASLHYSTGYGNSAFGAYSLVSNTTGIGNVALGLEAGADLFSGDYNVFVGTYAGTSVGASTNLTNSIAIGYAAQVTKSSQVVLGNTDITEILLHGNTGINVSPTTALNVLKNGLETDPIVLVQGNKSAMIQLDRGSDSKMSGVLNTGAGGSWFSGIFNSGVDQYDYGIGTSFNVSDQKIVIQTNGNLNVVGNISARTIKLIDAPTFSATHAAPSNVAWGTTPPDAWVKVIIGGVEGYIPWFTNHP